MKLIFLGAPGVGKGTQSKLISTEFKIPQISTGDILRAAKAAGSPLGLKVKEIMETGGLVSDEIVNALVQEKLESDECKNGFILDGYPRTTGQAETLDAFLNEKNMNDLKVINIEVPQHELVQRLVNRRKCNSCGADLNLMFVKTAACPKCNSTDLFHRTDDNEETITNRLKTYDKETKPLVEFYSAKNVVSSIDGTKDVTIVYNEIKSLITG